MPLTVPQEEKTYTTVYDGFKGVDFTNDASNIYRKRSPSGKNMLPNLDGSPYKRTGWEIELSAEDFIEAAHLFPAVTSSADPSGGTIARSSLPAAAKIVIGRAVRYGDNLYTITDVGESTVTLSEGWTAPTVTPDKVHYFELGGYDYLMIFNNLGVFSYMTNPVIDQDTGSTESNVSKILVHLDTYVDTSNVTQDFPPSGEAELDARRAFFFEGGGTAGFYIFVGLKMFRYDGAYLREVTPKIPTIMIGAEYRGTGTVFEPVNMLTPKRTVTYNCDGKYRVYTLPGGFASGTHPTVELLNSDGEWVEQRLGENYVEAQDIGRIDFMEGHTPPKADGEDNLKITYEADGVGATADETPVFLAEKVISVTRKRTQQRTRTGNKGTPTAWTTTKTEYSYGKQSFDTPNLKYNTSTKTRSYTLQCRNSTNTDWQTMAAANHSDTWASAQNKVTVTGTKALYTSSVPTSKTTGPTTSKSTAWKKKAGTKNTQYQTRTITDTKYYRVRVRYVKYIYKSGAKENKAVTAFSQCTRCLVFGQGIINQVFLSSTPYPEYNTRVWYSYATDPTYFPDTNYIEVGANDAPIMGLMKVGEYLGVIKQGVSFDTSIYLAYPTSFDEGTTYAVKQNVNGIGAISNGAFNTLNDEPLFLSKEGVMGIEVSTSDTDRQLRNRSYYVNKRLCAEPGLSQAISFVFQGMYYLSINNRCYVLDGSQKSSWANTKTNLQYECYYLENIPAQCFARMDDELFFTDNKGNLCKFKSENEDSVYRDAYSTGSPDWISLSAPADNRIPIANLAKEEETEDTPAVNDTVKYGDDWYTITVLESDSAVVEPGVPIDAVWSTIADDDGAVHFFKNLKKKGCVVSLLPASDSGVSVFIKADEKDPVKIGETDATEYELPFDFYTKKKIKKYKRLQFICQNNVLDDSFGVDQIVKTYTMGNYSKNKK